MTLENQILTKGYNLVGASAEAYLSDSIKFYRGDYDDVIAVRMDLVGDNLGGEIPSLGPIDSEQLIQIYFIFGKGKKQINKISGK